VSVTLPDGLLEDYEVLRHGVGTHALPRDVLVVRGTDAESYLQGQCSQDVAALRPGESALSFVLGPEGKVDALVRVTRDDEEAFLLDTEAGLGEQVAARLARFKLRSKVEIEALPWTGVALRGEGIAVPDGPERRPTGWALPFHHAGWSGVDLLGAAPAPPPVARPASDEAFEACRIESGLPGPGELADHPIPQETGLVEQTVSFTKGCYTGQELVARLDARGNKVARRLMGVVFAELEVDPAALLGADLVVAVDGEPKVVGQVTSAAFCPGVGAPAGLSYVHRSIKDGGLVWAELEDDQVSAEVRPLPLA